MLSVFYEGFTWHASGSKYRAQGSTAGYQARRNPSNLASLYNVKPAKGRCVSQNKVAMPAVNGAMAIRTGARR